MANDFMQLSDTEAWAVLNLAIKKAAEGQGYALERYPGRGRSNVWDVSKGGRSRKASFRTTRDGWIAYPPLDKGTRFRTLNDVEVVFAAAVDDPDDPQRIVVYEFPADIVRERFRASYNARIEAGQVVRDKFGMWVKLERDQSGRAAGVGSGLAEEYDPIGEYDIASLMDENGPPSGGGSQLPGASSTVTGTTIADVLADARKQIAALAHVRPEAVKLDLKIEY